MRRFFIGFVIVFVNDNQRVPVAGGGLFTDHDGLLDHDGVADHNGIAFRMPSHDGGAHGTTTTAQWGQVFFEKDGPDGSLVKGTKPHFAGIKITRVRFYFRADDAQDIVAPGLVAGCYQVVELVPTGTKVVQLQGAGHVSQPFLQEGRNGFAAFLPQPHVVVAGAFG